MKRIVWISLSIAVIFTATPTLRGQDGWQEDGTGIWENENDGGHTIYFNDYGGDNAVAVLYADEDGDGNGEGGGVTHDEGEMKKALEAAEDGHTYVPEGSDRAKWSGLPEQKEGEKKGSWLKRLFSGKKGKKSEGILDGCDPGELDDWMNGRLPRWGHGITIERGQSPVRMNDPHRTAGRIASSIR